MFKWLERFRNRSASPQSRRVSPGEAQANRARRSNQIDPMLVLDGARQQEADKVAADAAREAKRISIGKTIAEYLRTNIDALSARRITFQNRADALEFIITHNRTDGHRTQRAIFIGPYYGTVRHYSDDPDHHRQVIYDLEMEIDNRDPAEIWRVLVATALKNVVEYRY